MKKKLFLSLALGALFLWIAFRNVSLSEVVNEIKMIRWIYVVPIFFIGIFSHVLRALRWAVILKKIKPAKFSTLFGINSVGFLFVHILPFRLGEIVKPYLLMKREGVRMSTGVATVAIERVFDGLTLVGFLVFSFIFSHFKTNNIPYVGQSINYLITAGALIFGLAFIFLMLLVYSEKFALSFIAKLSSILPKRFSEKITGIAKRFVEGLTALPSLKANFWIFFYSIVIWLCSVYTMYLLFISFNMDLPWEASFAVLGIVSLGIMIPAAPGFVGTFQLFCQGALGLYGVAQTTGLSYSIVMHAINIACVVVLGLIYLPSNFVSYKAVMESKNEEVKETN